MLSAHRLDLSIDAYLERISRKTACLMAACCKGGAYIGGGTDAQVALLEQYGQNLGMAFQIIDDVLDYSGSLATVGKPVGNDLRQGLVTLPLIYALQGEQNGHVERVTNWSSAPNRTMPRSTRSCRGCAPAPAPKRRSTSPGTTPPAPAPYSPSSVHRRNGACLKSWSSSSWPAAASARADPAPKEPPMSTIIPTPTPELRARFDAAGGKPTMCAACSAISRRSTI